MGRLALATITAGDFYARMAEISHPTFGHYADKLGADFIVWRHCGKHTIPQYQKLEIAGLLDEFDRVLYVDTDILIREDAPDVFDLVPNGMLGMFAESSIADRSNFRDYLGAEFGLEWNGEYYNSGVIVASKQHREIFQSPRVETNHFYEQSYINGMIFRHNLDVFRLPYRFNRMFLMNRLTREARHDSYFLHYAGINAAISQSDLLTMMRGDLDVWAQAKPDYKFPLVSYP